MINKINTCRLSYLIFVLFISTLIIYLIHNGFQNIDIITIPTLTIILFLIIDLSAKNLFEKNIEKFTSEIIPKNNNNSQVILSEEEENTNVFRPLTINDSDSKIILPQLYNEKVPELKSYTNKLPEPKVYSSKINMPKINIPEEESDIRDLHNEEVKSLKNILQQKTQVKGKVEPASAFEKSKLGNLHTFSEDNDEIPESGELKNENNDSINPVNVNVSFNSNHPLSFTDFQ